MENLNRALEHPDWSWAYFRWLTQADLEAMDKALCDRKHPLAYMPGTKEARFRTLHASKYRF